MDFNALTTGVAAALPHLGAAGFGAIIGWYVYYVNRYRKGDVQLSDITTIVGVLGGASVAAVLQPGGALFGGFGIGLFAGFFGYYARLNKLVDSSANFDQDWFLDGRRKRPVEPFYVPDEIAQTVRPFAAGSDERLRVAERRLDQLSQEVTRVERESATPLAVIGAARIITACEAQWDANKSDCSSFAQAVATNLGVTLPTPADAIVDEITTGAGWVPLEDGIAAKQAADLGKLVVGGLKGADHQPPRTHGHVVIVVSGGLAHGKYPTAYWGTLGGVGAKNQTVNWAWKAVDRDQVQYAAQSV